MGGEEFVLVLPAVDAATAETLVGRLQAATPLAQSFSAGVALWDGQELSGELIQRADAAMYRAKTGGRARTVVDSGDRPRWPLKGSGVTLQPVPAQEARRPAVR
jgi:GGDEF domain-containing protein